MSNRAAGVRQILNLPVPKFSFGQELGYSWVDEEGFSHYYRGVVTGMLFVDFGWSYHLRFTSTPHEPWMVGLNSELFEPESDLEAVSSLGCPLAPFLCL